MKFSVDWLRQYVELPEEPAVIAEMLADAGLPVDAVEPWGADHQMDVDVMANRPDCMGHLGLARELAARTGRHLKPPAPSPERRGTPATELASVQVEDAGLCPRYTGLVITGVNIGPSPDWLEDRLASIGLRPVNNVVDVTNFVLHEYGQPLHAFDLDRLEGHGIVVRRARPDEVLDTLDGESRRLAPDHLVIADLARPVALAGIMGGANSEIDTRTTRVLLESAHFNPVTTRRCARHFQMHTDASHRFERGTDPGVCLEAALRAAALIAEVSGGALCPGDLDVGVENVSRREVSLSMGHLARLLGIEIEPERAAACLAALGFEVAPPEWSEGDARVDVKVPTWRGDVSREVDLIEEVGRIVGYDEIPFTLPAFNTEQTGLPSPSAGHDRLRRYLAAAGFYEALSFPMHDEEAQRAFAGSLLADGGDFVRLDNPLTRKMATLRISLLPGLLEGVAHNVNRDVQDVRLFEIGRVLHDPAPGEAAPCPPGTGPAEVRLPVERIHLGVVARGRRGPHDWRHAGHPLDYYDLKGLLDGIAQNHLSRTCSVTASDEVAYLASGEAGIVALDGEPVGAIGRLSPDLAATYDLPEEVFLLEIDISDLPLAPPPIDFVPPPRHPAVERDLALILDAGIAFENVAAAIRAEGDDWLERLRPFDRYVGKGIPAGKYSLAVRLSFRHPERTLTHDEVEAIQHRIVERLESGLGARLRDASAGPGQ